MSDIPCRKECTWVDRDFTVIFSWWLIIIIISSIFLQLFVVIVSLISHSSYVCLLYNFVERVIFVMNKFDVLIFSIPTWFAIRRTRSEFFARHCAIDKIPGLKWMWPEMCKGNTPIGMKYDFIVYRCNCTRKLRFNDFYVQDK